MRSKGTGWMTAPDFSRLAAYAEAQVDAGLPSVAIGIVLDGELVFNRAWGWALTHSTTEIDGVLRPAVPLPPEKRVLVSTETVYDLASNTKMFATNLALQRLVSERRLELDRPFPGGGEFTVRDVLHHCAGLAPDPQYPNRTEAGELWYQSSDPSERSGIRDIIDRTPLIAPPRTRFAYSDVGYMLLGLLVEEIVGERLDRYLAHEIFDPLGLRSTAFRPLDAGIGVERIAATELNGNTRDGAVSFGTLGDGTEVPIRRHTLRGEVHDEKAFYSMDTRSLHSWIASMRL